MNAGLIYVVDDDADLAGAVARLLRREGYSAEAMSDPNVLVDVYAQTPADCVVSDVMMGSSTGFDLSRKLRALDPAAAIVFMTAWGSSKGAVDAIRKYGGIDYLDKPLDQERLLTAIREGVGWSRTRRLKVEKLKRLSQRELSVFRLTVRGLSSKATAAELGLSPRTVEDHRARILAKTECSSLAELIALSESDAPTP